MSSLSQSSASSMRFKSILDKALTDFQKKTKKNLLDYWLATELKSCESIDDILDILRDQAKAVERTSADDRTLMTRIGSSVYVLSSISDTLGGGISLAFGPAKVIFAGISVLLSAAKGVKASHDALADLFGRIEDFFKRFQVYIESSPTTELLEVLVKVVVEILSILSIATKEMEQSLTKKYLKRLVGRTDIEDGLKKLDNLIQGEHGMATAQVLKVTSETRDDVKELVLAIEQMAEKAGQDKWNKIRELAQKWISPPDGPDPSTNHNIACKAYQEGTSTWFFEGSMFGDWMSRGSLLWVHGKPGSGKSILCSAIIQHIRALCDPEAGKAHLAYFYFDFRDKKKQNARNLLTSLLFQFSVLSDTCCGVISRLYSTHGNGTQNPTDDDLTKCLRQMLSVLAEHPTYIVMDALDECPDDSGWPKTPREEVLDVVHDLASLPLPNLRICVTSRPEVDIKSVLNPLTIYAFSLHDQSEQKKGIADYVRTIVNSDKKMRGWPDEDKELVIKELSERADGMFRWVVCQLETLRRSVQRNVRGILSKLPKTLDETYERVLRDIHEDNKEHARRLLHCLAVAVRPLFVEELAEILAFDFDAPEGGIPEFHMDWRWKDQEEAVLSTCSSLITIAEDGGSPSRRVVQFSHFSVKEFLMSARLASPTRDVSQYHILPGPAHTILAQACLGFLLQDTQKVEDFPLAKYAATHWVAHAQFQGVAVHVKCGMQDLFDPDKPHFASWIGIHDIDDRRSMFRKFTRATPLYYSALAGFYDLTKHLAIKHPQHINAIGGVCDFPLVVALSRRHIRVAELLLEHGGKVNIQETRGRTPLHILSDVDYYLDYTLVVSLFLLEHGADVNAQDNDQETPLFMAMRHKTSRLARFLLEHGADPGLKNRVGDSPLYTLLRSQFINILVAQLLLEHGADVNARNNYHRTPLSRAMEHRTSYFARFLLENGADPDLKNKAGKAPFHILLGFQRSGPNHRYHSADYILVVAQLLLEHGADVNARDNDHNTPLFLAMRHKATNLARFLLEHGADPNLQNKEGKSPFHKLLGLKDYGRDPYYHSAKYICVVAQLLLEHGADVNSRDNAHSTPLLLATRQGLSDVERFLLEHGADPNLRNVADQ